MTDAIALDAALDGADPFTLPSFLDRRGLSATRAPGLEAAGARHRAASPDAQPPSTRAALASAGAASLSEAKENPQRGNAAG